MSELPKEPPIGLLMSMAIRYDHGLGCPGYYDQPMMQALSATPLTHAQRLQGVLTTMRQLYEEVAGYGFHSAERDADYAGLAGAILPSSPPQPQEER